MWNEIERSFGNSNPTPISDHIAASVWGRPGSESGSSSAGYDYVRTSAPLLGHPRASQCTVFGDMTKGELIGGAIGYFTGATLAMFGTAFWEAKTGANPQQAHNIFHIAYNIGSLGGAYLGVKVADYLAHKNGVDDSMNYYNR